MEPLTLVAAGISCLAAVVSAWFARSNNVRELRNDVDSLSEMAEKSLRAVRTARMREVRAATRADVDSDAPPELAQASLELPKSSKEIKHMLRQKLFGRQH